MMPDDRANYSSHDADETDPTFLIEFYNDLDAGLYERTEKGGSVMKSVALFDIGETYSSMLSGMEGVLAWNTETRQWEEEAQFLEEEP